MKDYLYVVLFPKSFFYFRFFHELPTAAYVAVCKTDLMYGYTLQGGAVKWHYL